MCKRLVSTALVGLVALALLPAGGDAQSSAPIKIGVIEPLSGPVAASGNYVRMGAEIARDWVNARGGVNGRKIELQIEDNKSDPKEAASAAEKLIVRDKVPAIMGAWGSSMTLAAMPKLEEYGVPMVVETSSAASVTRRGNPWVFRISPPSEMEALGLEQYVDKLGVKKVDFLAVNTDWGRGSIQAFGDMLRKKGVQVGAAEFMEQSATDMNAQLTKIKQTGGDTLFLTTAVEQITLVLKQGQEQRLARKIVTTGGSSSPTQLIKQAGAAAEGSYHIVFFMPWFPEAMPDGRLAKAFVDVRGPHRGLPWPRRHRNHRRGGEARRPGRAQGHPGGALEGVHHRRQRADQVREGRARRQGERPEQAVDLHRAGARREGRAAGLPQEVAGRGRSWSSSCSTW